MLQWKPDHEPQTYSLGELSQIWTYEEENSSEATLPSRDGAALPSLSYRKTGLHGRHRLLCPSRDTRCLIPKTWWKKKKKEERLFKKKSDFEYGYLIWCWTNQVVGRRGSGIVPDQIFLCCSKIWQTKHNKWKKRLNKLHFYRLIKKTSALLSSIKDRLPHK